MCSSDKCLDLTHGLCMKKSFVNASTSNLNSPNYFNYSNSSKTDQTPMGLNLSKEPQFSRDLFNSFEQSELTEKDKENNIRELQASLVIIYIYI